MSAWPGYLLVFFGAGIGGVARYAVNLGSVRIYGSMSLGTVLVNVLGSFLIGLVAATLVTADPEREAFRLLLATGMLGGFTTFSAFSLDAAVLWQRGDLVAAGSYVLASVGLSLGAVLAGLALGARIIA